MPAFLFDMDGTMVDSMPWHARSWVAFAHEVGVPPPDMGFFRRTTGLTGVEVMREFFGEVGQGDQAGVWEHEPVLRPEFRAETRRQVIKVLKRRKAEEMV